MGTKKALGFDPQQSKTGLGSSFILRCLEINPRWWRLNWRLGQIEITDVLGLVICYVKYDPVLSLEGGGVDLHTDTRDLGSDHSGVKMSNK